MPPAASEWNRLGDEGWKKRYRYDEPRKDEVTLSAIDRMSVGSIKPRRRDV